MSKGKICAVCHNEYSFCPVCQKDKDKPVWMFTFCGQNCHDIYQVTSAYGEKKIDANTAKQKLDKLDLSQLSNFGESYQNVIADINKNTTPKKIENIKNENIDKVKDSPKKKWVKSNVE